MKIKDTRDGVIFASGEQVEFLGFLHKIADTDRVIKHIILPIIANGGQIPTAGIDFAQICTANGISRATDVPDRIMRFWKIMSGADITSSATEEWLDSTKAADYLRLSRRIIRILAKAGLLYARKDKSGKYRFNKGSLNAWLAKNGYPNPNLRG
jgi:hypothetical protein